MEERECEENGKNKEVGRKAYRGMKDRDRHNNSKESMFGREEEEYEQNGEEKL